MISTALAGAEQPTQWCQLVDLLAQRRAGDGEARARAFASLRANRDRVDLATRVATARSLAGLPVAPALLAFFAEDVPAVSAPLIGSARLGRDDWLALLPRLGPTGRSLLRHRRDLPAEVRQALAAFGPTDFVIEGSVETAGATGGESQIRELVERIEAYRRQKGEAPAPAPAPAAEPVEGFRWETGSDGVIRWVEGAPRGPLVGEGIAAIAGPGQYGVDGQAAGALAKRAPFRDARFAVAGIGPAAGEWRISGVPFFDPVRGGFLGYRGTARRPRVDETARAEPGGGVFGAQFQPDALRQLIHELRTPLNAIIGFAEMIEGQYLGPAASGYRGRAAEIMDQARRLLSAVDDLDTAARIETDRLELDPGAVDAGALVARLHHSYAQLAEERGAMLRLEIAPELPPARLPPDTAERIFARLLAATTGLARSGETLGATLGATISSKEALLEFAIDRPEAVAGLGEAELLDPGFSPEGDWPEAPALGLGFALRLVRNLAGAAGGALRIGESRIRLLLPALTEAAPLAGNGEAGG
ncbi:MAG: sensor histidine kinase [Sphingosinicella sp.]